MSDSWKDYLAPVGSAVLLAGTAAWRFFVGRRKRWDELEDAEKKRRDDELARLRKELEDMTARWLREVDLGAQRAVARPPRGIPESLPPPSFKEPEKFRKLREVTETKALRRMRRGDPSPDDTLTSFKVDTTKPPEDPIRHRQISVVEIDGRRKPDRR